MVKPGETAPRSCPDLHGSTLLNPSWCSTFFPQPKASRTAAHSRMRHRQAVQALLQRRVDGEDHVHFPLLITQKGSTNGDIFCLGRDVIYLRMYNIYIYIYVCTYVNMYVYIYICIQKYYNILNIYTYMSDSRYMNDSIDIATFSG